MKRFLLPAFALALAVNTNATSFQANMSAEQQATAQVADGSKTFSGDLTVYLEGGILMGTTEQSKILLTKEPDGKYTFVLKKFNVAGLNVGDATVPGIEGKEENGTIILEATDVEATVAGGDLEGTVSTITMSMKATIKGDYMVADISKVDVPNVAKAYASFESKVYPSITLLDDFEGTWEKCIPWDTAGNTKQSGKTPKGWCVSNVYTSIVSKAFVVGTRLDIYDDESDFAVSLKNTDYAGQKIPAYMTLGTSWATAIGADGHDADGGSFGGKDFTSRPDAISFDYMRDNSKGDENATVVAYLWKGTFKQKNVPGNTALIPFGIKKCEMTDRDRNILGMPTDRGGDVATENNATCIASFTHNITKSTNNKWESLTIPFEYKTSDTPEKINIIFSATDYFNRSKIVSGNSLCVDNVKYVYYHSLSDIKLNGTTIEGFNENRTEYTVKGNMADYKNALDCTPKSANSTKNVNWNDAENLVTITVKGSNYAEDNESMTVYTIKFEGTGTGIHNVTSTSTNSANGAIYDLSGRQLKTMQKGINIVRGKDGKMIKVMK